MEEMWACGFSPRPLAYGTMSAPLPLVRQRGASSSSHGVGVSAGSLCVSAGLHLKVASYNIGVNDPMSWRSSPKQEDEFADQLSQDLCKLAPLVNVMFLGK